MLLMSDLGSKYFKFIFNGSAAAYIEFVDAFVSTVHNNRTLSIQERTTIPFHICSDNVRAICGIVQTNDFDFYKQMIFNLYENYSEDLDYEEAYQKKLQKMSRAQDGDVDCLHQIIGVSNTYMMRAKKSHSKLIYNEIVRLIPSQTYVWFTIKFERKSDQTLQNLTKFFRLMIKYIISYKYICSFRTEGFPSSECTIKCSICSIPHSEFVGWQWWV